MEILSVQDLNKSFGTHKVLHNVSFQIQAGEIVGLIGPNGAGKSTIMKAILGLINYENGTIKIAGKVTSFTNHQALKNVGALIEYPGIYPFMTGLDHLKLFANQPERIQQVVSWLKMDKYIDRKAKGYSLGMKQKLGIALALVNQPQLVILDEPMNGLDPQSVKDLRLLIKSLADKGITFLISSHILSELEKLAESLVIIKKGEIIERTTMTKMINRDTHYIMLKTNDDNKAEGVLKQAGYTISQSNPLTVVQTQNNQVANLVKLLEKNKIIIKDIQHDNGSLEHSLLQLLGE